MSKHEDVAREIDRNCAEVTSDMDNVSETIIVTGKINISKTVKILMEHFPTDSPAPLKCGDWVDCKTWNEHWSPCLIIQDSKVCNIEGFKDHIHKDAKLTKHTFTESDLELLDTEDVKYKLHQQFNNKDFYVQLTKKSNDDNFRSFFDHPTADEAIESAFRSVLADNLLKKECKS